MEQPAAPPMPQPVEPTGITAVDAVLDQMSSVADCPIAEHAAVFERAHAQLRRALDAQVEAAPDDGQGA